MNIIIQRAKDGWCYLLRYLSNVTVTPSQIVTKEGDICTWGTRGTDAEQNTESEAENRQMKEGKSERKREWASEIWSEWCVWLSFQRQIGGLSLRGSRALLFQQVTQLTPASKWRWMHLISLLPKLQLSIETSTHVQTPKSPHTHINHQSNTGFTAKLFLFYIHFNISMSEWEKCCLWLHM